MPGFEIFGDEERAEVGHVLDTGVLFRYGFDGVRDGVWKAPFCHGATAEHTMLTLSRVSWLRTRPRQASR